mgnify:CR=1 FL=1
MGSEIRQERVYGNWKPAKGYAREKRTNSQNYKRRPGMSEAHLACIRSLACCVCGAAPRNEAHHLKAGTGERGMGLRSTDKHAVPLCTHHHQEIEGQGARNEPKWFRSHGIFDALELALALWQASGDLDRMTRVIEAHRGE